MQRKIIYIIFNKFKIPKLSLNLLKTMQLIEFHMFKKTYDYDHAISL